MSSISIPVKFLTSGHCDHGKSSLSGQILYQAGAIPEHQLQESKKKAEANKRKGFEFAYLLDENKEEQDNGITIDYNLVNFEFEGCRFVLVDCPGHKIYIRNLIAGLNATNPAETIGCLVVSVANGEYESGIGGGQTREDALLLRAVGITTLVLILNKIDLVPQDSPRYQKIQQEMEAHLKKLGFPTIRTIGISAYHGTNIPELLRLLKEIAPQPKALAITSEVIDSPTIICHIKILYEEEASFLITAGFTLILHLGSEEYQATIEALKIDGKRVPYAKNGETVVAKFSSLDQSFRVRVKDRVILRRDDYTIGFGVVKG